MRRRQFLNYVGVAAAGAAVGWASSYVTGEVGYRVSPKVTTVTQKEVQTTTWTEAETVTETPSCLVPLRSVAETGGLLVGAAVTPQYLEGTRYATTLAHEFNFVTTESEMKWWKVHPDPDRWNFAPADTLVKFASDHQMKVKGHTLIWKDERTPEWVKAERSTEEFPEIFQEHIKTLVGRYRSRSMLAETRRLHRWFFLWMKWGF